MSLLHLLSSSSSASSLFLYFPFSSFLPLSFNSSYCILHKAVYWKLSVWNYRFDKAKSIQILTIKIQTWFRVSFRKYCLFIHTWGNATYVLFDWLIGASVFAKPLVDSCPAPGMLKPENLSAVACGQGTEYHKHSPSLRLFQTFPYPLSIESRVPGTPPPQLSHPSSIIMLFFAFWKGSFLVRLDCKRFKWPNFMKEEQLTQPRARPEGILFGETVLDTFCHPGWCKRNVSACPPAMPERSLLSPALSLPPSRTGHVQTLLLWCWEGFGHWRLFEFKGT